MDGNQILKILSVLIACVGAWSDWKTRKIPNRLINWALAAGLAFNMVFHGLQGVPRSLGGAAVGFACILFWIMGALKAGDVKLYMVIGAAGGWRFVLETMTASILIGGVAASFLMVVKKRGRKSLVNLWNYGINIFLCREFHIYQPSEDSSYFCFGWCIAAGATAAFLRGFL